MKIIIRAVLASAALCAIFGQAGNAADDPGPANPSPLPPPVLAPIYSWTGIYMGINAGYGTARLIESASRGADSLSASESGSGLIAGGQIGANYQSGVFVVGFEVDTGPQATAEEMSCRLAGNSASAFFGNIREALFESVLAHNQRHEKVGQALPLDFFEARECGKQTGVG